MPKNSIIHELAQNLLVILLMNDNEIYLKDLPNLLKKDKGQCSRIVKRIIDDDILPIEIQKE